MAGRNLPIMLPFVIEINMKLLFGRKPKKMNASIFAIWNGHSVLHI